MPGSGLTGNGSTLSFGGTVSYVTDMEYAEECAAIDCTVLASTLKVYEAGLPKRTCTATVLGISTYTIGKEAALVATFYGCTPTSSLHFVCVENSADGGVEGVTKSTLKFVQ